MNVPFQLLKAMKVLKFCEVHAGAIENLNTWVAVLNRKIRVEGAILIRPCALHVENMRAFDP